MKFKKLSACFAALALAASIIPSAYAATYSADYNDNFAISATEKTNIEVEDAFHYLGDYGSNYFQNDAAASGGKYWQSGWWDGKENLLTNTISVAEAGDYEVHFVTLQRANNLSAATLKVDDEIIATNENSIDAPRTNFGPGSSLVQEAGWTDDGGVFHHFNDYFTDYSKVITLSEGTHTITLMLNFYGGASRVAGAIDNITFEKIANAEPVVVPAGGAKYEVEDVYDIGINLVDNENASGGKLISSGWTTVAVDKTRQFDITEEGYYDLHFVMSGQDAYNNFDTIKVKVDGSVILNNDKNSTTHKVEAGFSTFTTVYDYSSKIYLTAGVHDVQIVSVCVNNTSRHALSMDTIEFAAAGMPEINVGNSKAEYDFESLFAWGSDYLSDSEAANGGKFVKMADHMDELEKDAAVINAENSGIYKFRLVSLPKSNNFSKVVVKIDGEAVLDNENSSYSGTSISSYEALREYYNTVYLASGAHTLKIEYTKGMASNLRHALSFDTLSLEPMGTPELSADGGRIEAEDLFGTEYLTDNENASGGKLLHNPWGYSVAETLRGAVDATAEGWYNVELLTTKRGSSVSTAVLSVNGVPAIYTDLNGASTGTPLSTVYPNANFEIYSHVASAPVYLNEGENSIKIVYYPSQDGGNVVKFALDYIEFTPYEGEIDYTSDLADIAEYPFFVNDDSYPVSVFCNDNIIENGDLYQITYASSDERVLTVDADGYITPKATGYSDVSVVVSMGGSVKGKFAERVFVVENEEQAFIGKATLEDGTLTFVAQNANEEGFDGVAIIAVYDGETLVSTQFVELSKNNGSDNIYTADVTKEASNTVKIFAWDSIAGMTPIWVSTIVK